MFRLSYPDKVSPDNSKLVSYLLDVRQSEVDEIFSAWFEHASTEHSPVASSKGK